MCGSAGAEPNRARLPFPLRMDAELLHINTTARTADALAWIALVGESLDAHAAVPATRHIRPGLGDPSALTGVSAIALRTNDVTAMVRTGASFLISPSGHSVRGLLDDLDSVRPRGLTVHWDSPAWEVARRFGLNHRLPRLSTDQHLHLSAISRIRARALHHTAPLHLFSDTPTADRVSEFQVRVLDPAWAALEAIVGFDEVALLARTGSIPAQRTVAQFRSAVTTVIRAYRAFPDACNAFFTGVGAGRDDMDEVINSSWQPFLTTLVERFVQYPAAITTPPTALSGLDIRSGTGDPTVRYVQAREVIRHLARNVGVETTFNARNHSGPTFGT